MALVLFDTNIIIDHFNGHSAATRELANYGDSAISAVSWIEVACRMTDAERGAFNMLLANIHIAILQLDAVSMERAATLRRDTAKKLPDCMIRATAEVRGRIIITRNPKDFGGIGSLVHVPYDIVNGVAVNIQSPPS